MSTVLSRARQAAALILVLSGAAACGEPPTSSTEPDRDVALHIQGSVIDVETDLPIPSAQVGLVEPGLSILGIQGKIWAIVSVGAGGQYILRTRVTRCSGSVLRLRARADGYADHVFPSYDDDRSVRCIEDPQSFDFRLRKWSPHPPPG